MKKHGVGIKGDLEVAKGRLKAAGIPVVGFHTYFVENPESGSEGMTAMVEAETLEDAVNQVRKAVLGTDDDDDSTFDIRPIPE